MTSVAEVEAVHRRRYPQFLRVAVAVLGDVERGTVAASLHDAHARLRDVLSEVKR